LRKDAPIYMAEKARPDFAGNASIATLQRIDIIPRYQLQLTTGSNASPPGRISQR
jgi:hypothetical protein